MNLLAASLAWSERPCVQNFKMFKKKKKSFMPSLCLSSTLCTILPRCDPCNRLGSHSLFLTLLTPPPHPTPLALLPRCVSFLFGLLSQDKTLPPSSCSPASLSLSGCCCSSRSSSWPPTAYGENSGGGREATGGEDDRSGRQEKLTA